MPEEETGPPERHAELERMVGDLLLTGMRAAMLKEEIERRLRAGSALLDTSRRLREESQSLIDWRRRRNRGR